MKTAKRWRIHRFHDTIGLSCETAGQLYLTRADALALARELRRFATADELWYATRIVENGRARNEADGKARARQV